MSSPYNPKEFWYERGKSYKEKFEYNKKYKLQEQMIVDYLKTISSFLTVLEVGCGFGRINKILLSNFPDIEEYVGIDLSPHQIENAKEYVKLVKAKQLKFIVSDIESFQSDKKYDLVIASEVLMHILPSEIEEVMRKLVDRSNQHVVNIDWYEEKTPIKAAPHNFIHHYEKIYQDIPSVMQVNRISIVKKGLLSKIDVKQSIFHALLRN
jgi:cyclopropane fatty-acyl-phospholipid synthase-like methyltransferase